VEDNGVVAMITGMLSSRHKECSVLLLFHLRPFVVPVEIVTFVPIMVVLFQSDSVASATSQVCVQRDDDVSRNHTSP